MLDNVTGGPYHAYPAPAYPIQPSTLYGHPVVLLVSSLRLIVFPLGAALLLKALHVDQMTMNLCVILLAMPVASNTAAMAERYGGDYVFASACVSVSTLLSVITVPVITWLIQLI